MDRKRVRGLARHAVMLALAMAATAALPRAVHAQDRAKASYRLEEGKRALAGGRVDDAIAALEEAHGVLKTPASALAYAQALDKKGRLVEALAVADAGKAVPKAPKETFAAMKTRADLDALVQALDKRVPRLRVEGDAGTTVKVDGKDAILLAGVVRVDPGQHAVETVRAGVVATAQITVAEGEEKLFSGTASPPAARESDAGKEAAAKPAEKAPAPPTQVAKKSATGPNGATVAALVGFTSFAFGAGLGVGGFLVSRARLADLETACPDGECAPYAASEHRDATATQTVAFAAFGVAGAGLVTGIVGAALSGRSEADEAQKTANIHVSVGAASVMVEGSF